MCIVRPICIVIMTVLLLLQCILNQSVQWRFNAFTLENVSGGNVSILFISMLSIFVFRVP